jgi:hypothetical protein
MHEKFILMHEKFSELRKIEVPKGKKKTHNAVAWGKEETLGR